MPEFRLVKPTPPILGIGDTGVTAAFSAEVSPSQFAWAIGDNLQMTALRGATTTLATNAAGTTHYISPDLLPGQSTSLSGSTLLLSTASDAPTVVDNSGAWSIVVMDSPYAVATRYSAGGGTTTWGAGQSGPNAHIGNALHPNYGALDGDVLEVSPGAFMSNLSQLGLYGWFDIWRSVTIRNIAGKAYWRLHPPGQNMGAGSASGIWINTPNNCGGRKNITIEGFDFDYWGTSGDANGIDAKANLNSTSLADFHQSITLRNFKLGRPGTGETGMGISGPAETWNIESGLVYDCVTASGGTSHNFYLSGHTCNMKGVRSLRTRRVGANNEFVADGHIFKSRVANHNFDGCVFAGIAPGDNTCVVQIANGGNVAMRGCVLVQGTTPTSRRGLLDYENEGTSITPWEMVGRTHSLNVRNNVFISRDVNVPYQGTSMVNIRYGDANEVPISSGNISIADNIGSNAIRAVSDWIVANPSLALPAWLANNSQIAYSSTDAWAVNPLLYDHRVAAGAIAGTAGQVSTQRFMYPSRSVARTDSFRGLG